MLIAKFCRSCACLTLVFGLPVFAQASGVSLDDYRRAYINFAPQLHKMMAEAESRKASALGVAAQDRLDFYLSPFARGDGLFYQSAQSQGLGSFGGSEAGIVYQDTSGGRTTVNVAGTLYTDESLTGTGHTAGGSVRYQMPLLRNRFGRNFALQAEAGDVQAETAALSAQDLRLQGCRDAGYFYLDVLGAQELLKIEIELYQAKAKITERTRREYSRRLVTRLDLLAAESDLNQSAESVQLAEANHRAAWQRAKTFAPELANDVDVVWPEPGTENQNDAVHPLVQQFRLAQKAQSGIVEVQKNALRPELWMIPEIGLNYFSRQFQPPGLNAPLTDLYGQLSLRLEWPLIASQAKAEIDAARFTVLALKSEGDEAQRQLSERQVALMVRRTQNEAILPIAEERIELTEKQVNEAQGLYYQGRLEYQDFLQHFAFSADARRRLLQIKIDAARLDIDAEYLSGLTPAACEELSP